MKQLLIKEKLNIAKLKFLAFALLILTASSTIKAITIPLDFYSNYNLPFGLRADVTFTFPEDISPASDDQETSINEFSGIPKQTQIERQAYNLSVNTNSPYTVLFEFKERHLANKSEIKYRIFNTLHTFTGSWTDIEFEVPYYPGTYLDQSLGNLTSTTLKLRAFVTEQNSTDYGQSFLGISPGPESLGNYSFFHQYDKETGFN